MKHFMVEVTYTIPAEQFGDLTNQHRTFLDHGFAQGMLLCAGPMVPRTGGIIIARAESLEALHALFANDPYIVNNVATYRYIEFNPIKRQPLLEGWISGD